MLLIGQYILSIVFPEVLQNFIALRQNNRISKSLVDKQGKGQTICASVIREQIHCVGSIARRGIKVAFEPQGLSWAGTDMNLEIQNSGIFPN